MTALTYTRAYMRKTVPFIALLFILLVITTLFNLKFSWGGVDLILRVYVYALAFLIIYNVY